MLTRRLELRVDTPQLVVHPVDVGAQGAQLVAVLDLHVAREVARRDRGEARVDVLDRSDHRPREDEPEQQRQNDRPRRDADEQCPRARIRAFVPGDQIFHIVHEPVRQDGGVLDQVTREQLGSRSGLEHLLGRLAVVAVERDQLLLHQRLEPSRGVVDLPQVVPVFQGRHESESILGRPRLDPDDRVDHEQVHLARARPAGVVPDVAVGGSGVLGEERSDLPNGMLELAVRDGSPLERPEAPDAIVRLSQHELPEQTDRDEQQGGADERDQQLRSDRDRRTGDGTDERVAHPPPLGGGPKLLLLGQDAQASRTVEPPIMFVISHAPPIRATSKSAAVTDTTSPVFAST